MKVRMIGIRTLTHEGRRAVGKSPGITLSKLAIAAVASLPAFFAAAPSAIAQSNERITVQQRIDIPAGPLNRSVLAISSAFDVDILVPSELVSGKRASALSGNLGFKQALETVLAGSGLTYAPAGDGAFVIVRQADETDDGPIQLNPITVEGQGDFGPNELPPAYAGGQVARGSRIGLLGNQDVFDTPFSVTGYTSELIRNQHARDIPDVIANDASARLMNPSWNRTDGTTSIRGFNTGGAAAPLYDGLPGLYTDRSNIEIVERLEIFKGANSLLSGAVGSVGGTMNIVPKRPLDEALTRLTADYESRSQFAVLADVSRRFGSEDRFGVRLNGLYRKGETAYENNDLEVLATGLAFDFRSDRFRASLALDYYDLEAFAEPLVFVATEIPDVPDTKDAIAQPWEFSRRESVRGLTRIEYDLTDNWSIHGAFGASYLDSVGIRAVGINLDSSGDFLLRDRGIFKSESYQQSGAAGIRGSFDTGSISHAVSIQGMGNWRRNNSNPRTFQLLPSNIYDPVFYPLPDLSSTNDNLKKSSETFNSSFAIADTLGFFGDRALLTVGLRYQNVGSRSFDVSTGDLTSEYDEFALTPAFGLVVKPWPSLSLYGNYIEALERGRTAPSTAINADEVFPPSKTNQVEFGVKYDAGSLGVTAGVFQIEKPSGLIDANNRFAIDGEQRNRGVELNIFGEVAPGLRVLGGLTYIDAELTKTQDGLLDGEPADGTPALTAVMGLEWDPQAIPGLSLGFRARHTGSQFVLGDKETKLPSYQIYSLNARYTYEIGDLPVTFRASVNNLLDTDYWTSFIGSSSSTLYLGEPRVIALSATVDF